MYIQKGIEDNSLITILDNSFKSQQKNTKKILKTLGYPIENIENIYFSLGVVNKK